ncbi:universal stress protein [Microbacterium gorillae]|uniref:universal stress protein n=1 Tax=Microbacterium gorillae TaxID=1231063 RepID=UPI001E5FC337|nr:universal stress protein [Microbacterium gorillae]
MSQNDPRAIRSDEELRGAVVVGLVAGQSPHVVQEAARFATLFATSLVVVTVDQGRYLSFDDPTGMIPNASVELAKEAVGAEVEAIELETANALVGHDVRWTMRTAAGDPAIAISDVAKAVDASLIVVGTRRPGLGETLREFFNGSVAARLAHRQSRSVLVVPTEKPVPADHPIVPEG